MTYEMVKQVARLGTAALNAAKTYEQRRRDIVRIKSLEAATSMHRPKDVESIVTTAKQIEGWINR